MIKSVKKFYRQRFKGQLFIIKASGRIITDKKARRNLLENIQALTKDGVKILLIYGAGEAIDEALTEAGRTPKKLTGGGSHQKKISYWSKKHSPAIWDSGSLKP